MAEQSRQKLVIVSGKPARRRRDDGASADTEIYVDENGQVVARGTGIDSSGQTSVDLESRAGTSSTGAGANTGGEATGDVTSVDTGSSASAQNGGTQAESQGTGNARSGPQTWVMCTKRYSGIGSTKL